MKSFLQKLVATLLQWGLSGLFLAALLDGAGVPVPGGVDVLVVYLANRMPDQVLWLTTVAVLGSVIGNLFLFFIARRGGQIFLEKRATSSRSKKFRRWFERYGLATVFVSALVPLPIMPMKIFVFSAGAMGSNPLRFVLVFVAARIPRYLGLALMGRAMGDDALGYLKLHVWHLTAFAALLLVVLMTLVRLAERRGNPVIATE
jgi:membrane protein YqaA with SNARE-associated domain